MVGPVRMKLTGFAELRNKLTRLPENINDDVDPILEQGAEDVAETARRLITTGRRTGRMYGDHRASAPGEPPANWTGALVASIHNRKGARRLNHYVEAAAEHALPLEFGTYKMAARPFLHPAMERHRDKILRNLKKAVHTNIKKKGKR